MHRKRSAPGEGFPTNDEFATASKAILDAMEFEIDPLVERIAGPLVDAYESSKRIEFTWADVGRLTAQAASVVDCAEMLLKEARKLQTVAADVAETVRVGETFPPKLGRTGYPFVEADAA